MKDRRIVYVILLFAILLNLFFGLACGDGGGSGVVKEAGDAVKTYKENTLSPLGDAIGISNALERSTYKRNK